jgi:hypothetical protein
MLEHRRDAAVLCLPCRSSSRRQHVGSSRLSFPLWVTQPRGRQPSVLFVGGHRCACFSALLWPRSVHGRLLALFSSFAGTLTRTLAPGLRLGTGVRKVSEVTVSLVFAFSQAQAISAPSRLARGQRPEDQAGRVPRERGARRARRLSAPLRE